LVELYFNESPVATAWGLDMVVAEIEIDKDHTASLYCEKDQVEKLTWLLNETEYSFRIYKRK
jgi:hypothetical protein